MSEILISLLYPLHILIFLGWIVPFFIPLSLWKKRIEFHFYYAAANIIIIQVWGLWYTFKIGGYHTICFLTTIMQKLRGYDLLDPRNYQHSFVKEFLAVFGIDIILPIRFFMIVLFVIITVQFIHRKIKSH